MPYNFWFVELILHREVDLTGGLGPEVQVPGAALELGNDAGGGGARHVEGHISCDRIGETGADGARRTRIIAEIRLHEERRI